MRIDCSEIAGWVILVVVCAVAIASTIVLVVNSDNTAAVKIAYFKTQQLAIAASAPASTCPP